MIYADQIFPTEVMGRTLGTSAGCTPAYVLPLAGVSPACDHEIPRDHACALRAHNTNLGSTTGHGGTPAGTILNAKRPEPLIPMSQLNNRENSIPALLACHAKH